MDAHASNAGGFEGSVCGNGFRVDELFLGREEVVYWVALLKFH